MIGRGLMQVSFALIYAYTYVHETESTSMYICMYYVHVHHSACVFKRMCVDTLRNAYGAAL